jgi:hypothetical protein
VVVPALDGRAVVVGDHHGGGCDRHHLVLAELDGVAGVPDERGDVRAEEVLAVSDADDERRVAARADDGVRDVGVHGEQRERALEPLADRAHRGGRSPSSS